MPNFGEIYWRKGAKALASADAHYVVVLGFDRNGDVLFQTLSSRILKIFRTGSTDFAKKMDVDCVSFLNPSKYSSILSKDTFINMGHGPLREHQYVFTTKVQNGGYRLRGKLRGHNEKSLIVSLCESKNFSLSKYDAALIASCYNAPARIKPIP